MKFHLLEDTSTSVSKPFSLSRTHLVWWTFIILSSLVAIVWGSGQIPVLSQSTLILLGIGAATSVSTSLTDISDSKKAAVTGTASNLNRNSESESFFLDILSDNDGVSIHRLQAVVFNMLFGIWFIYEVFKHIKGIGPSTPLDTVINKIMPEFSTNNLILLGMSSGTYIALKTVENSQVSQPTASNPQLVVLQPQTQNASQPVVVQQPIVQAGQPALQQTTDLPPQSVSPTVGEQPIAPAQQQDMPMATDTSVPQQPAQS